METKNDQENPLPLRVTELAINTFLAWGIFVWSTGSVIPTGSGESVWFLAAVAFWFFTLLAAPYFTPPRDSVSTAVSLILLLAPLDLEGAGPFAQQLRIFTGATLLMALFVTLAALVAIFKRDTKIGSAGFKVSGIVGKGTLLFTPAVVVSVLGFYADRPGWQAIVFSFWVLVCTVRPAKIAINLFLYLLGTRNSHEALEPTGLIVRVDDPGIVRVALGKNGVAWRNRKVHIAVLPDSEQFYVLPLFTQVQNEEIIGTGLCCESRPENNPNRGIGLVYETADDDGLAQDAAKTIGGIENAGQLIGLVTDGSSIGAIRFRVLREAKLEEGTVVFATIRKTKVYYQVLDAQTSEETFQKNPHGYHTVSAVQLGSFTPDLGFQKFPWLPEMNQTLFVVEKEGGEKESLAENEFIVGRVANTSFGVPVVLDDLVEYHTAVLGITGTGKTELTLDIIRNALDRGTKVFCVDFTGEYKVRLEDKKPQMIGLSVDQGSELERHLFAVETGEYGAKAEKAALKAFLDTIKPQVTGRIDEFLNQPDQRLGIFELSEITNTKATLRTTELYLSAIMDWAKQHRKAERILIVLEEAHTIIPESYGSGFDAETQWVVGRIGQIALQGRKYGVGLLLVSQRTALVSKTVLSQCNTYFTHSLVDKTSLDYLAGVYGPEHVRAIPNLRFLEFVACGKGVKSQRPILGRRDYEPTKNEESKKLDFKRG